LYWDQSERGGEERQYRLSPAGFGEKLALWTLQSWNLLGLEADRFDSIEHAPEDGARCFAAAAQDRSKRRAHKPAMVRSDSF